MARARVRRVAALAAGIAVPVIVLTACGSSSSGSSSNGSASSGASSAAPADTPAASGTAAATGVPTLAQLYQGNEGKPPASSPPAAKGKTVWWISCGQQSAACSGYAAAGKAAAEAIGWNFHLADGNLNVANGYATAMRTALAAHPDAIIEDGFSCSTVQPELEQAKQQNVPVIGVDTTDCNDDKTGPALFSVPMTYSTQYATPQEWWTGWGEWSGNFVAADSGGNAKVIVADGQGDPQFTYLDNGFKSALAKCAGCSIVADVPWTLSSLGPSGAWLPALRNALLKNPDATYVWFPFDFNTVESGGAKAVLASGSKAKVISNTGLGNALDLIRSGQVYAEATAKSSEWESWAAIDELNRYFNHQPSVSEGLGFISITKDHNLPATAGANYQTSVPFEQLYKKAWGVS